MSDTIVFGATGFIGRPLVRELLSRGHRVAAAVRGSGDHLTTWLADEYADTSRLTIVRADITKPHLGIPANTLNGALAEVQDVYNAAGRYAFGLTVAEAKAGNVTGARHVVEWAATQPNLRRLVHVSGYRVSGPASPPPDYRKLGAYEASKIEGDTVVRTRARELGVPLTIANPSTVIGEGQYIGLATMVSDLWRGKLPALPGGPDVFLPVVTVDHLVQLLANLPEHNATADDAYWILDDTTPNLPGLIRHLASHLGVSAPKRSIPIGLVRRLPRALTGADPESLSFLSSDRYPTASANAFAEVTGVQVPPVTEALSGWADHLVATRFGAMPPPRQPAGFHDLAGSRTWIVGERQIPEYVLLHGLPLDSDSWADVADRLSMSWLAADLPGLGRSAPAVSAAAGGEAWLADLDAWLADLMRPVTTRPVLVAHSLACGPALRYATDHPERVGGLVFIAPSFLLHPSSRTARSPLAGIALSRTTADGLAKMLRLPSSAAVESAAAHLRRPGAARRAIKALRADYRARAELRTLLKDVSIPIRLVVGSEDPLASPSDVPVSIVQGAGHYLQLTAPDAVAQALVDVSAAYRRTAAS